MLQLPSMSTLTNYLDKDGNAVCPACGKAIGPAEPTARVQDCMTHLKCFREARQRAMAGLDPCEPTP